MAKGLMINNVIIFNFQHPKIPNPQPLQKNMSRNVLIIVEDAIMLLYDINIPLFRYFMKPNIVEKQM